MSSRHLWRVTASVLPEAEDAVSEFLTAARRQFAVSYTDLETGKSIARFIRTKAELANCEPATSSWTTTDS